MLAKNKITIAIAVSSVAIALSGTAHAQLLIHTDQGANGGISGLFSGVSSIGAHLTNLGEKGYIDKNITGSGDRLPIQLAMDSILPSGWKSNYSKGLDGKQVSWNKDGNWNEVLEDIAQNNNLVITIDWAHKRVNLNEMSPDEPLLSGKTSGKSSLSTNKISAIGDLDTNVENANSDVVVTHKVQKKSKLTTVEHSDIKKTRKLITNPLLTHHDNSLPLPPTMGKSIALVDGLIYCQENGDKVRVDSDISDNGIEFNHDVKLTKIGKCENQKVNIEKMIMDTDWLENAKKGSGDKLGKGSKNNGDEKQKSSKTIGKGENEKVSLTDDQIEKRLIAENEVKQRGLRSDYSKSYILPKNGSFESFVNNGGKIHNANPTDRYVYVYKKGKLFDTINKWSELNGFTVKNDVYDKEHIDYPNIADVKLEGNYKEVVTAVLNKYRNADTPLLHVFLESGGSHVLHIFDSKYQASYL
ncbi:hypothetical protein [Photobacterium kishitanii]|uniref:Toxin co-regulated pilus biosynthesis protein Q C-terminal domain-containing protein n=1 Tax=Photobacterium kishitanii TaxID=318456 RepID=A0A2T3KN10_9GAMM|nr:hypothetical protein [Photobacterium kishitanii]PSV01186.1 hypothetical protein C9J27_03950 [Photobacterium kishitanii]